ncbi:MAG: putative AAA+ superfamily ATPase [Flavobacteriales bacterium]|jgi:predicted AAA+ superfamily ATPase
MPRRLYFLLFKPLVKEREIRRAVVLMGPRRVGKTVMLYHMVQELIENGVKNNQN